MMDLPTPPKPLVLSGPRGMPVHPHLHPLKHSRDATDADKQPTNLPRSRHDLHVILNSERWTHHRSLNHLRLERERLLSDIESLKKECSAWATAWHTANSELLRCQSLRIEQTQKFQEHSCELHESKVSQAVRITPILVDPPRSSADTG